MRTIVSSYIATNLVCASVMALLWLQNRKRFNGIGFWLGNYAAICIGFVLVALRGIIPDFLSIVIANAVIVHGILLLYMGLERFVGKAGRQTHNYILLAIFTLIHAWFTYLQPSLLARDINASVFMTIYAFQIVWLVFRRLDVSTAARLRSMGVIAAFFCLVNIARIAMNLMENPGNDFLKDTSDSIVFLLYQTLQIAIALSLFLQVNRRLVEDLENDIIERKRAEKALRESERQQLLLLQSTDQGVYGVDREGLCNFMNKAAAQMLGYQPDEVIGRDMHALIHYAGPDGSPYLAEKCSIFNSFRTGQAARITDEMLWRKDGSAFAVEYSSNPIREDGNILGAVIAFSDITERKRAEEALRASEALYRQMFTDHSAIQLLVEPESGAIVEANPAAVNFYGYPADALLRMNISQINTLTPEEIVKIRQDVKAGALTYFSVPHRLASGEIREVEVNSAPIVVNGRCLLYSIVYDITERKQAEELLRQTQAQIVEQQRTVVTLEERERMARELHDGIGQVLGYVNVQTQAAHTLLEKDQRAAAQKKPGRRHSSSAGRARQPAAYYFRLARYIITAARLLPGVARVFEFLPSGLGHRNRFQPAARRIARAARRSGRSNPARHSGSAGQYPQTRRSATGGSADQPASRRNLLYYQRRWARIRCTKSARREAGTFRAEHHARTRRASRRAAGGSLQRWTWNADICACPAHFNSRIGSKRCLQFTHPVGGRPAALFEWLAKPVESARLDDHRHGARRTRSLRAGQDPASRCSADGCANAKMRRHRSHAPDQVRVPRCQSGAADRLRG
jgi:PAS domain S-box-containing protein